MSKTKNVILVAVAHPDDEVLGLGGTLLRHKKAGDEIHILILGDGEESRDQGVDVPGRAEMAREVSKQLGVSSLQLQSYPDNEFDSQTLLAITKTVEKHIETIKPDTIYTHYSQDLNIDHRLTAQSVMTAARPMPGGVVKNIYMLETVSSTEWQTPDGTHPFMPNMFVDISDFLESKLDLLRVYDREMRTYPHARSYKAVENLAKLRGAAVGYNAAEAFMVARELRD